ncbi:MAG: protein-methionine-sulfoxide reductase catalytic subunit MsrP [Gemmatimonadota bacterium]|nr:protein-methionine-sulfoxide reductase catalytic subunit MsrP [Gemmatimonadota bacterium]
MHLIHKPDIPSSEITDESLFFGRRKFLSAMGFGGAAMAVASSPLLACTNDAAGQASQDEKPNTWEEITTYNNFYEFGTGKGDPSKNAGNFRTRPWTVEIAGEVKKPGTMSFDDLLRGLPTVERTYRHRCVEAWSMVVPWNGVLLKDLIAKLEPTGNAKFIEFTTLLDPAQMPGQRSRVLDWPYVEGLRLDEAMHPLSMMVTGIYGKPVPNQNGAPLRLVVPWKYGFKGGKSIVKIRFTERQPATTWNMAIPSEYGFYANVNPTVDHPRWSQGRERRIGKLFQQPTLMFNGYADQVASLYAGMDLRRNY